MTSDDIVPSPETDTLKTSSQTLAFGAWFDRFCNECKILCHQNIESLYHNSPNKKFAQKQFNECYQEIIQKAKNVQQTAGSLTEQRKFFEQIIMDSTSAFIQCLQAFKKQYVAIKLNDTPEYGIGRKLLGLLTKHVQLEKFFIKKAADSFKGQTTLYLDIVQRAGRLESNALISFKKKIIQQYEKHIKNFCNACASISRGQTQILRKKPLAL